MSNQLIKTTELGKENVFPRTRILDLFDDTSGLKLIDILKSFNMMFVPYLGNKPYTRNQISPELRRQGLWLTYVIDNTVYTEWYDEVAIDDTNWGSDSNWRQGSNALVGDLSISPNGTWVINGEDSGITIKGDKGDSPVIRIYDNKILVSYDKGVTYEDLNNTPVYTKFRFNSLTNTYLVSYDLGGTWLDISDEKVYHKFRYNLVTNTYLESINFGKTWSNISAEKVYYRFRFNKDTNTYQVSTDLGLNWTDVSSDKVYYQFKYNRETNTHLVSTDFGATWTNVSEDKVFYQFRTNDNRLLVSTDLGTTWENCSEPIAAWFRWADTSGTGNIGKVLISRDNLNWSDLSPTMTNNLYIKGYVAAISNLPSNAAIGDIYMVGPTYDESDTTHDYPHYRMWIKLPSGWVDNGEFTNAGPVSTSNIIDGAVTLNKLSTDTQAGIIYDVSAHNDEAVFESIQAILSSSNLSTLIPTSVRHGGMTIRFIQGSEQSYDNKYVQYRLMTTSFSTNVANWQGIDEEPTTGSNNLVKSGGVANKLAELEEITGLIKETSSKIEIVPQPYLYMTIKGVFKKGNSAILYLNDENNALNQENLFPVSLIKNGMTISDNSILKPNTYRKIVFNNDCDTIKVYIQQGQQVGLGNLSFKVDYRDIYIKLGDIDTKIATNKESIDLEEGKEKVLIYSSSTIEYEEDLENRKVFFYINDAVRYIRVRNGKNGVSKDISIAELAIELGTQIVKSTQGTSNCIALESATTLCYNYNLNIFEIVDRSNVKKEHLILLANVNGHIVDYSNKISCVHSSIISIKNSLETVKNDSNELFSIITDVSSNYEVTGQESSGVTLFLRDLPSMEGIPFILKIQDEGNTFGYATDAIATFADGTSKTLISKLEKNTEYRIVPSSEIIQISVFVQKSQLTGNTGLIKLSLYREDNIERNIKKISESVDGIIYESKFVVSGQDEGRTLSLKAPLKPNVSFYLNFVDKDKVAIKFVDVFARFFDGSSEKLGVELLPNTDYKYILDKELVSIDCWFGKSFQTGNSGSLIMSVKSVNVNDIDDKLTNFKSKLELNKTWKDYANKIQNVRNGQFALCVQTDTHVDFVNPESPEYSNAMAGNNLKLLGAYIGADGIANLGDMVQGYEFDDVDDMKVTMSEMVNRYSYPTPCPVYLAVGNHEDDWLYANQHGVDTISNIEIYSRMFMPIFKTMANYSKNGNSMYYYDDHDNFRIVVLNSQDSVTTWNFAFGDAQINWFINTALNTNKQVIVMCHAPLLLSITQNVPSGADAILNALKEFKVRGGIVVGVLCGHVHMQAMGDYNGIKIVTFKETTKVCETLLIDAVERHVTTVGLGVENREWYY